MNHLEQLAARLEYRMALKEYEQAHSHMLDAVGGERVRRSQQVWDLGAYAHVAERLADRILFAGREPEALWY